VLRGNLRLPWANLLKAERLEENPADPVAVEPNQKLTQANLLILKRGC